jgi:hypothetical protein
MYRDQKRLVVARGWGENIGRQCLKALEFEFGRWVVMTHAYQNE